jgi:DNA-binding MarR family transcriptional regulator
VPNHLTIQIASNFDALYPTASAKATESAMNLVFTADLLLKRISTLLQPLNLTPTSALVLSMLANSEMPLPPHEIAARLIISRATVTGLLDSLERREYICRLPHQSDRRMVLIEITEAGRQAVDEFRPIVHQHQKEWFEVLNEREQQQLIDTLHRLQDSWLDSPD